MENHQGPNLWPVLLNNFISDLGGVTLVKFANDTKLGGMVNALENKATIQRHLGVVEEWGPCAVQHREMPMPTLGSQSPRQRSGLDTACLGSSSAEKSLGPQGTASSSKGHQNEALQKQPQDQEIEGSDNPP